MGVLAPSAASATGPLRQIDLTEWQSADIALTPQQAVDLMRCPSEVLRIQAIANSVYRVQARPIVGRLGLGSVTVTIHPKYRMPSLLAMLAEVHDLTRLLPKLTGYETTADVVDLVVQMFLQQVDRVLRQGLKRRYVEHAEEVAAVRGRINLRMSTGLNLRGRPNVFCHFQDYTIDCVENQVLVAALESIVRNPACPVHRRELAHRLISEFPEVAAPANPLRSGALQADRLAPHYHPALELAQLILEATGVLPRYGLTESSGFLVNMNALFEKFIYRQLSRRLAMNGVSVEGQLRRAFDQAGQAYVQPDLIITDPTGRRLVADTKYKVGVDPDRNDLYQMLAYCRILRVRRGALITIGSGAPRIYNVKDDYTTISVVAVDLGGTNDDVARSIRALCHELLGLMQAD